MLNDEEEKYVAYWAQNREKESTNAYKFITGLPRATLMALPILLLLFIVRIFIPDWYAKLASAAGNSIVFIVIAVLILIIFTAWLRMHFLWEQKEQRYRELLYKKDLP